MKRRKKFGFLAGLSLLCLASCSGASGSSDVINLRILNSEDYIGEGVLDGFTEYWNQKHASEGKTIKIIYDTFDTNETMLSSLKTGKSTYDLICPSDYMVQKMMSQGMLEPFSTEEEAEKDPEHNYYTSDYFTYVSPYLLGQLDAITSDNGSGEICPISDYCRGYMWGTLGILYNPAKVASDKGLDEDEVKYDMSSWDSLWNEKYHLEMSVKDSMRDTYSVGIMKVYEQDILNAMEESGDFDMDTLEILPGHYEHATAISDTDGYTSYAEALAEIFNRCSEDQVKEVEKALMELKANVFGFEVDSGKDDIIKGLIGMNLAWSGDAVYSMDQAQNERDTYIYYSIPETGGNIWFDSWVMPKSNSLHKAEAQEFVDYLSSPEVAAVGMDTIGYTSFVAGDTILDLIRSWYDPRSFAMYVYHDDPDDWESSDFVYDDNDDYVYQDGTGVHEDGDDYGSFDMTGSTYEEAVVNGEHMSWEAYQEKYNAEVAESKDDQIAWDVRDLTYMFEGTLEEVPETLGDTPDTNPYLFYTDELETIEDPEGSGKTVVAGRQFYTQYPDETLIPKLAVMKDYGSNNKYVLSMWETVKGNNLPVWGVVVFSILLAALLAAIIAVAVTKHNVKKIKVARRKEVAAELAEQGEE